jgi:hypothetical protein
LSKSGAKRTYRTRKSPVLKAIIAQADEAAQIWWEAATVFQREHPMVLTFGAALGLTPAQIDDLFRLAGETT